MFNALLQHLPCRCSRGRLHSPGCTQQNQTRGPPWPPPSHHCSPSSWLSSTRHLHAYRPETFEFSPCVTQKLNTLQNQNRSTPTEEPCCPPHFTDGPRSAWPVLQLKAHHLSTSLPHLVPTINPGQAWKYLILPKPFISS